jgi:hypothetical protein
VRKAGRRTKSLKFPKTVAKTPRRTRNRQKTERPKKRQKGRKSPHSVRKTGRQTKSPKIPKTPRRAGNYTKSETPKKRYGKPPAPHKGRKTRHFARKTGRQTRSPKILKTIPKNTPPDEKLPQIRNAEKAIPKTGRAAKRPQIQAFRAENGPPDTQPENPENGTENSNPRPMALPATGHDSHQMNIYDHALSIPRRLPSEARRADLHQPRASPGGTIAISFQPAL